MTIIIASSTAGACLLALTLLAIVAAYVAIYQYRRRRRVKFIQASIWYVVRHQLPKMTVYVKRH